MTRMERKAMADARAMEEQSERMNPLDGRGATPSMGLSQVRGGIVMGDEMALPFKKFGRRSKRLPMEMEEKKEGGSFVPDYISDPMGQYKDAFAQGNQLMEHLHKLHGKGYARSFHEGMKGGLGTGRYEGKGFWDDFKKGFNMVFEPVASVAKVVAPFLGHPEVTAGLSAVGYGKMSKMADELHGSGKITKRERSALQAVLDRHRGGMCGGMDWSKIARIAMPLSEQMLGMGLPKSHYNKFQKLMKELQKKKMEGGMSMSRQVGGAKHKKEEMECESDSEEKEGAGEMPPAYARKMAKFEELKKNAPVNRGAGASDGRKKRAEIVKKVMAEKGLSMINASKYVKEHNLY